MSINVLCWEGYGDPLVLKQYERAGGGSVRTHSHFSDFAAAQGVLGNPGAWDVLNINSPFVRDYLHPRGRIRELDADRFHSLIKTGPMPAAFKELGQWGFSAAGEIIGVCQRFGPFNLVVNTNAISVAAAEDQGFDLVADQRHCGRYGILAYDDFNVFHIAIACGLDPFEAQTEAAIAGFGAQATRWFAGARLVTTNHRELNRALINCDIAFYLGGGIYTASCARRDGHPEIRAITPRKGPMRGRGGIAFVEVNAVLADAPAAAEAETFLASLLDPETARNAALAGHAANPVLQMSNPKVLPLFSKEMLDAMQWDTLEEELGRCAQYRIAPDYRRLHTILVSARAAAGWSAIK